MERAPLANCFVLGSDCWGQVRLMYEVHRVTKQAEYKVGLALIAQFQVFHDVREVNAFVRGPGKIALTSSAASSSRLVGTGPGGACGEGCDVPRGEPVQVHLRRTHNEVDHPERAWPVRGRGRHAPVSRSESRQRQPCSLRPMATLPHGGSVNPLPLPAEFSVLVESTQRETGEPVRFRTTLSRERGFFQGPAP